MAKKEFSMTCEVCGDEVVGHNGEYAEAKCKGCGSFFEYNEGMMIKLTGEQCQKLADKQKKIQVFHGEKVTCVEAQNAATQHVKHWVCYTPKASRELVARLDKAPQKWLHIRTYYATAHDVGDKHDEVPK